MIIFHNSNQKFSTKAAHSTLKDDKTYSSSQHKNYEIDYTINQWKSLVAHGNSSNQITVSVRWCINLKSWYYSAQWWQRQPAVAAEKSFLHKIIKALHTSLAVKVLISNYKISRINKNKLMSQQKKATQSRKSVKSWVIIIAKILECCSCNNNKTYQDSNQSNFPIQRL